MKKIIYKIPAENFTDNETGTDLLVYYYENDPMPYWISYDNGSGKPGIDIARFDKWVELEIWIIKHILNPLIK